MKQGAIWYANLNPSKGNEQRGIRPVVIISGNAMNDHMGICIVCPLTSKVKKYAGCLVLEPDSKNNLSQRSEILTFQIRTIIKTRLINRIGTITAEQLATIKTGLQEILTY
ncbi:MAG: type II toxin-antitoxin system PemK/MazF family toxin [Phaeodactylibacter sp.]|nr:type II toxin-antitoxin system PemK/MazF family toxin [Phaeodactylibacter sp.]